MARGAGEVAPPRALTARLLRRNWWLPLAGVLVALAGALVERLATREWSPAACDAPDACLAGAP